MKPIRIKPENAGAIVAALKDVNGSASEHTFTEYQEINMVVWCATKQLEKLHLPESFHVGAVFRGHSGAEVANAYQYRRIGTAVTIERRKSGWFLTKIARVTLWNKPTKSQLFLTEEQHHEVMKRVRWCYSIRDPKLEAIDALRNQAFVEEV